MYGHAASHSFTLQARPLNPSSHPNIVQLCATASSGNIHTTIFRDGVIHSFLNTNTDELNIDLTWGEADALHGRTRTLLLVVMYCLFKIQ
jgi:hypothetical protein